jgi:hypothetical protein
MPFRGWRSALASQDCSGCWRRFVHGSALRGEWKVRFLEFAIHFLAGERRIPLRRTRIAQPQFNHLTCQRRQLSAQGERGGLLGVFREKAACFIRAPSRARSKPSATRTFHNFSFERERPYRRLRRCELRRVEARDAKTVEAAREFRRAPKPYMDKTYGELRD